MATVEIQSSAGTRPAAPAHGWSWGLLVLIWTPLLWRLARMWRSETEQLFGFGVPVLVAWLLWQRRDEWTKPAVAAARGASGIAGTAAVVLALALVVLEANPLWPKAVWAGTGAALVLTLAVIAMGHGWHGARKAAPVLVLMLTALKWPTFIYEPVMHTLMHFNAVIAAELVNFSGTPAMVQGNVIEVARGMVGVNEACSGLRSLQTVIMMALFLGEMDRFRLRRRLVLLGGAILAALLVNIVRTTVLTWVFANRGPAVEERWHDPAGVIALFVTLALVWLWSERVGSRQPAAEIEPVAEVNTGVRAPAWRPLALAVACVAVGEVGTQVWYGAHEQGIAEQRVSWSLAPAADSGWSAVEVPAQSAEILRYESGDSFARELTAPSRQLLAFAFRWSADLARIGMPEVHDPRVCLPSVGAVEEAELPDERVTVDGIEVPFRFVRFRQGLMTQHVWFCLWSTRAGRADSTRLQGGDITQLRWERVRAGLRNDEREQLIFFVQGEPDDESAAHSLRDAVLTLMQRR
ncbi:exosortase/archaeosortase family protein [Rariglobus hedericola]|uniref:Exosortase/archaeosortase family protein n=1 Tax=Rariglobus hedericola TaxID=2597822 RepID=A0A556QLI3_9BACT|nr:exosortase/archaeosortase family protein [Rariglobus hedericola]TSJ77497.1 exosortase/archaeosortase family protein [Rariglobus hedericola]